MINGFVGFQFHEDGTPMSLWFLRISCFVVWGVCFFVAISTFNGYAGMAYNKTTGLFITYLIVPAICAIIYTVSQLILVIRTLDDRWVIGDVVFAIFFYVAGLVILFGFSNEICDAISHYIDGVFFATLCMLFTVMMIYKYWDCASRFLYHNPSRKLTPAITKEDLEFSVASKEAVWEVKDPLLPVRPISFPLSQPGSGITPAKCRMGRRRHAKPVPRRRRISSRWIRRKQHVQQLHGPPTGLSTTVSATSLTAGGTRWICPWAWLWTILDSLMDFVLYSDMHCVCLRGLASGGGMLARIACKWIKGLRLD